MSKKREIYLDNAASAWPKAPGVQAAIADWFARLGVDASRGGSARHSEVRHAIGELRAALGRETGCPAKQVVLCSGATAAINLFLHGFLAPGSRVWTTGSEHNAVVRPLAALRERDEIEVRVFSSGADGTASSQEIEAALESGPAPTLFVASHASNVTGRVQDLAGVLPKLRKAGARVLLDCAQSAGRLPLSELPCDAIAVPGHKGYLGPPGVGALCLREELPLRPLILGGTGSGRESMPSALPHALEAGTPNTPGYLGWLAGMRFVEQQGRDAILRHELSLIDSLRAALAPALDSGRATALGNSEEPRVGILSLTFEESDPAELASVLDNEGILVRAGLHCAAWVHDSLPGGEMGTLRFSPGPFNTKEEMLLAAQIVIDALEAGL